MLGPTDSPYENRAARDPVQGIFRGKDQHYRTVGVLCDLAFRQGFRHRPGAEHVLSRHRGGVGRYGIAKGVPAVLLHH